MKKLMGGILLAAGLIIAGLSGLCSLVFIVAGLVGAAQSDGQGFVSIVISGVPLVAMVGGIPFAIGFGLYKFGQSLIRSAKAEEDIDSLR
jgi:hypothetical protein